jgi:hypothetical protein
MNPEKARMSSQPIITLYDTPAHVPQPWAPNIWRVRYVHIQLLRHRSTDTACFKHLQIQYVNLFTERVVCLY